MTTLSFYDQELNLIDKGKFDVAKIDELFNERFANQNGHFDNMEQMLSKTSFCLSRDDNDFLAIDCQKNGKVGIQSDRLCYPSDFLSKLRNIFRNKDYLSGEVDLNTAKTICQDYINLDRQAFENKYQMFYSY